MKQIEFEIKGCDLNFRTAYVSPIDLLAITTQIDFDNYKQTKELYTFVLEHIEVKVGEKWFPVKYPGKDVYMPTSIEDNFTVLSALNSWFLENVIEKAFTDSSK